LNSYVGITDLHAVDEIAGGLASGFTGVVRGHRRQGVATALKMRAVEYAREHGFNLIRAFNNHANLPMLAVNERIGFARRFSYVSLEKCLKKVKKIDPAIYDRYAGQYRIDPAHLERRNLPAGLTFTVKRVGDRLLSEIRDMQDELFPQSKTRFFTKMHYGEVEFVTDERGVAKHLVYREPEEEFRADKIS
ncbi:MAG TPA: GNAT family N-acetyltransferase, partial [Blastocatellia bacterium]|nr:GNAT family N-acetyltransferase [Blastocatellia bacterium]